MSDDRMDHSAAPIIWLSDAPPEVVAKVREDIANELGDLGCPEDLIFHVVTLTTDYEGPCVVLSGRDGGFNATYEPAYEPITFPISALAPDVRAAIEAVANEDDDTPTTNQGD